MQSRLLNAGPQKTYALILSTGEDVLPCILQFAKEQHLGGSQLTAIGAFERVVLGYFDWQRKDYKRIPVDGQVEVVSMIGDIALNDGEPALHVHVVIGRSDGIAMGGHLLEARVRPTLEIVITESPAHLVRRHDAETGLALIRF
ncbi:MAG TPA: PPC domain-containing DNA-binding protein [Casimicrobiaceae bacterium]|nr:PPC domain-containing DNA-binding protein [Casimicrobiaceae bacterium]